jgi:alpha-glucosidase
MYFNKVDTPNNFRFATGPADNLRIGDEELRCQVDDCGSDVFRVRLSGRRWPGGSGSHAGLDARDFSGQASRASLRTNDGGGLTLSLDGDMLLESAPGRGFGVNGPKWVQCFRHDPAKRFYGMGEKNNGFEKSGLRTLFWNTDVWADFDHHPVVDGVTDPMYADFPVLIIRSGAAWAAIVVDNPYPVFMNTGAGESIFQAEAAVFRQELFFGARDGAPDFWMIAASNPADLVRRIQTLQGRTPLPPLWALGHQQCRWGYRGPEDLERIARGFEEHGIPNDGLWLDIDYMDGYRVFTVNQAHFPDAAAQLKALRDRGFKVVPILDPGLRQDPDWPVYAEARAAGILCHTPEGKEFVGYVWPGYTVFPDFSLPEARDFWAAKVAGLTNLGFDGYWIDMNDPSTGSVPNEDMLFGRGALPHAAWHNQYALGMAEATKTGLEAARPGERPFVISRSAFLSQARHSAVWTGDNYSNVRHLKGSIALSLNLAVSGMPFNGPDVPGFGGDSSDDLMRTWYKAGCLFPFLRNHSLAGTAHQEPWSRGRRTTAVTGEYIRLRYKLLPYLYNLFIDQEERGDPIIRPLWYHDPAEDTALTDDQFFVGPAIMQAPFTDPGMRRREILLPAHSAGRSWFDVQNRRFTEATSLNLPNTDEATPLFLAAPALIPMQAGIRTSAANDLADIEFLVVLSRGQRVEYIYRFDDGHSLGYRTGLRSACRLTADWSGATPALKLTAESLAAGRLRCRLLFLADTPLETCLVDGRTINLRREKLRLAGRDLKVMASEALVVED